MRPLSYVPKVPFGRQRCPLARLLFEESGMDWSCQRLATCLEEASKWEKYALDMDARSSRHSFFVIVSLLVSHTNRRIAQRWLQFAFVLARIATKGELGMRGRNLETANSNEKIHNRPCLRHCLAGCAKACSFGSCAARVAATPPAPSVVVYLHPHRAALKQKASKRDKGDRGGQIALPALPTAATPPRSTPRIRPTRPQSTQRRNKDARSSTLNRDAALQELGRCDTLRPIREGGRGTRPPQFIDIAKQRCVGS
jgi:hypothetical protein